MTPIVRRVQGKEGGEEVDRHIGGDFGKKISLQITKPENRTDPRKSLVGIITILNDYCRESAREGSERRGASVGKLFACQNWGGGTSDETKFKLKRKKIEEGTGS